MVQAPEPAFRAQVRVAHRVLVVRGPVLPVPQPEELQAPLPRLPAIVPLPHPAAALPARVLVVRRAAVQVPAVPQVQAVLARVVRQQPPLAQRLQHPLPAMPTSRNGARLTS